MVGTLSGADLESVNSGSLQARVTVETSDSRFIAHVSLAIASTVQVRDLEADDCWLLARAVAIVVAVALDPLAVAAEVHTSTSTEPTLPEPTPEPAPTSALGLDAVVPAPAPQPSRAPASNLRAARGRTEVELGIAAGMGGLLLPQVGAGFKLEPVVGFARADHDTRFQVRFVAEYWLPRLENFGDLDAGARIQLVSGGGRGCVAPRTARWRFPICVGADAGAMIGHGEGDDLTDHDTVSVFWAAAVFDLGAEVLLTGRIGVFAEFEGAIAFVRPRFTSDDGELLYEAGRFGPRGFLGLRIRLL